MLPEVADLDGAAAREVDVVGLHVPEKGYGTMGYCRSTVSIDLPMHDACNGEEGEASADLSHDHHDHFRRNRLKNRFSLRLKNAYRIQPTVNNPYRTSPANWSLYLLMSDSSEYRRGRTMWRSPDETATACEWRMFS